MALLAKGQITISNVNDGQNGSDGVIHSATAPSDKT